MMRLLILLCLCGAAFAAHAQDMSLDEIINTMDAGVDTTSPPLTQENIEQNVTPQYEDKPLAVLQTLDKLTARTSTITVPIGKPTSVGPLFIDVKTCKKTPPSEKPESATFIQVWETKRPEPSKTVRQKKPTTQNQSQWVFSGWMFASSPALSAINHPVYDVWLKDCIDNTSNDAE